VKTITLFLLGKRGYRVLDAATQSGLAQSIAEVVIGTDKQVLDDHADEIATHCQTYGIAYRRRAPEGGSAVAAGWRWLIAGRFRQVVVFHDSLLPKYRGFNPLITALLRQDQEVGVTAIIANNEYDRGDVIDRRSAQLTYPIKVAEAIERVSGLYFDLAQSVLPCLLREGALVGTPQDDTVASYSVWRDDEDYRIAWARSAEEIVHQIDCMGFPYRGASAMHEGRLIRILEAEAEQDVEVANRDSGKVLFVRHGQPVVICGTGLLRLLKAVDENGVSVLPFDKFRVRLQ